MPTMETLVLERADDGVVTLTLNRPARKNAMNAAMFNELLAILREIDASTTDRRVLVITGARATRSAPEPTSPSAGATRATQCSGCTGWPTSPSRSIASPPSPSSPR